MTASLTARDRVVVLALMALNAEVTNDELKKRVGLRLDGEARRRLNETGLITSVRRGRGYVHKLSQHGVDWCEKEIAKEAPPASTPAVRALYAVLAGLHGFLERTNRQLSDVYGVERVESRIRAAYWKLADGPAAWVRITDVRKLLDDVPAADADAAFLRLDRERDVHLTPETDQRLLSPADRGAAVRVGAKDMHLLRVDR